MPVDRKDSDDSSGDWCGTPAHELLSEVRNQIDQVDGEITSLINSRLKLVRRVSEIKQNFDLPTLDEGREQAVLAKALKKADDADAAKVIEEVFRLLMSLSKAHQEKQRSTTSR